MLSPFINSMLFRPLTEALDLTIPQAVRGPGCSRVSRSSDVRYVANASMPVLPPGSQSTRSATANRGALSGLRSAERLSAGCWRKILIQAADKHGPTRRFVAKGTPGCLYRMRAGWFARSPRVDTRTNASAPSTAMPTARNGRRHSQTSGYRIRAAKANGQDRTSRIHQSRNFTTNPISSRVYTQVNRALFGLPHCRSAPQSW